LIAYGELRGERATYMNAVCFCDACCES
jgi:hypothetical protein